MYLALHWNYHLRCNSSSLSANCSLPTGSSEHWLCVYCDGNGVIQVIDSLGSSMGLNLATILQISKIYSIPSTHSSLKLRKLSVQQQNGTLDCGLFSVAYATEVCFGNSPEDVTFNQKKMRSHLYECLCRGKMVPFPRASSTEEVLPRPSEGLLEIKVYCWCKLPEEYDSVMIACDDCKEWYHCSCVGIHPSHVPDHWDCSQCRLQSN